MDKSMQCPLSSWNGEKKEQKSEKKEQKNGKKGTTKKFLTSPRDFYFHYRFTIGLL